MTNFRPVIRQAYLDILRREPDAGGADHYNAMMNATPPLTEAQLRESLVRSGEYSLKNPDEIELPPPQGSMAPLRVAEGRFTAGGQPVQMYGFVLCCSSDTPGVPDEAVSCGWPSTINDETLELLARNKVNLVHVRLGPFSPEGETTENIAYALQDDGRVDLNRWSESFWSRLDHFLRKAMSLGIYVELDLVDCWVLEHDLSPWRADRNVQGFNGGDDSILTVAPHAVARAWVREAVRRTKSFTNVIYQDGNEAWERGGSSPAWVSGLRNVLREETSDDEHNESYRLFATNTGRFGESDYVTFHQDVAHEFDSRAPVCVNEYPTRPQDAVVAQVQESRDNGTTFYYWPGGHTWPMREEVLAQIKGIAEGASPMPAECPWLVRMGAKVHNVMDAHHGQIESRIPVVGGFVVFDLTPRFSSDKNDLRGSPCNDEHNSECGGRRCEDMRGGVWSQVGGPPAEHRTQEHNFQLKVGPIPGPGTYVFRCDPPSNYTDQHGKPVRVAPQAPRNCEFTVGQPA